MLGLTVLQPWCTAIALSDPQALGPEVAKGIENRSWEPWKKAIGAYLAIHAGVAAFEQQDAIDVGRQLYGQDAPHGTWPTWIARLTSDSGKIIAVAKLTGFVRSARELRPAQRRWKIPGQFGWVLEEVRALPIPIVFRGLQGLWIVPSDTERDIRQQVQF